jgi:hypothetical protein
MSLFKNESRLEFDDTKPTFFLELSPQMKSIRNFDDTAWQKQVEAIQEQQKAQTDLNRVMTLAVSPGDDTTTYSMVKSFKHLASAERMISVMREKDVTMRLNIMRNNAHSATHTCMELSADALEGLIASESDENIKTIHLRSLSDSGKEIAKNGDMFVSLSVNPSGQHFFSHVEYSIDNDLDRKLSGK